MCMPEAPYGVPRPNGRGEGICCTEPLMNAECPPNAAIGYCFHDHRCIGDQGALCQTGIGAKCIDYGTYTLQKHCKKNLFCSIENESQKVSSPFITIVMVFLGQKVNFQKRPQFCEMVQFFYSISRADNYFRLTTIILRLAEPGEKRCYRNWNTSFYAEIC